MQTPLSKHSLASLVGEFTWSFGQTFFVQTPLGNYVWSDPDYQGDNTLTKFNGNYRDWIKQEGVSFGRDKGRHIISDYCGIDTIVVE